MSSTEKVARSREKGKAIEPAFCRQKRLVGRGQKNTAARKKEGRERPVPSRTNQYLSSLFVRWFLSSPARTQRWWGGSHINLSLLSHRSDSSARGFSPPEMTTSHRPTSHHRPGLEIG